LLYTSQNLLGTIFRVTFTVFYRRIWNIVGKYSILCCDTLAPRALGTAGISPRLAPTKTTATQLAPTTAPPPRTYKARAYQTTRLPNPRLASLAPTKPAPHKPRTSQLAATRSPLPAFTSPSRRYQYKIGGKSLRLVSGESRSKLAPRRYHYPILKNCNCSYLGSSDSRSQPAHRRYNYPNPRNINHGGAAENHPALNDISTSAPWPVAEGPSG
jgi:hypothetical protein